MRYPHVVAVWQPRFARTIDVMRLAGLLQGSGRSVCVVDLHPVGFSTRAARFVPLPGVGSVDLVTGEASLADVVESTPVGVQLVPVSAGFAKDGGVEPVVQIGALGAALSEWDAPADVVLIDWTVIPAPVLFAADDAVGVCPPSLVDASTDFLWREVEQAWRGNPGLSRPLVRSLDEVVLAAQIEGRYP